MFQHLVYVRNNVILKAAGEHFNLPGHDKNNMKFTIIEKVISQDPLFGGEREKYTLENLTLFMHESTGSHHILLYSTLTFVDIL